MYQTNEINKSIFICSGGRCGTHWVRPILAQVLDLIAGMDLKGYNPNKIPFKTEPDIIWRIKMKEKREFGGNIYSGHMSLTSLLPIVNLVNIVILIRDPRDMCISAAYYQLAYNQINQINQGEFEQNLKALLFQGGPNPDFNKSYINSRHRIPHILLKYEDMIKDDFGSISKILNSFNYNYEEEKLKDVLNKNSFKKLSGGREVGEEDNSAFYRKGIIGDWKNYLTEEMNQKFCEEHHNLMQVWGYEK